jgi:integrase
VARYKSLQRGTAVLQKRQGGEVWTIRYRVRDPTSKSGWKQKREALPDCKSLKQALGVLSQRVSEQNVLNNSPRQAVGMTFESFASGLWQSYLENRNVKPSTVYSYQSMLNRYLLPSFGKRRLEEVTTVDLTQFFTKLRRKLAPKYALNLYALLRTMFEVATEYDLIASSPVRRKLHRPHGESKEKPGLGAAQIRQIIDNVPAQHRPLFLLAAVTGLRLGEVLAVRWGNIDFLDQILSVTHSLWRDQLVKPKTEASARSIHLPASLVDVLLSHKDRSPFTGPADFVFCKRDGAPLDPNYLRKKVLYPAMELAGIERRARAHGFHMFRHSAGSIVHAKTGDLKLAQELLGHARISTTSDIYVHVPEKMAKLATEIIAGELCCAQVVPMIEGESNCAQIVPKSQEPVN